MIDLQNQIEEARPIRLEKTKRKRKESLQEFLILFFTEWNDEKNTIYVDDRDLQTDTGRRRSLGDIYMICKYYYPDLTLKDLLYELYVALPKHFENGFRTSWCNTIHKRVWYYDPDDENGIYNKAKHDEYGNPYRYYLALFGPVPEDGEEEEVCGNCGEHLNNCECGNENETTEYDYEDEYEAEPCGDPECTECY